MISYRRRRTFYCQLPVYARVFMHIFWENLSSLSWRSAAAISLWKFPHRRGTGSINSDLISRFIQGIFSNVLEGLGRKRYTSLVCFNIESREGFGKPHSDVSSANWGWIFSVFEVLLPTCPGILIGSEARTTETSRFSRYFIESLQGWKMSPFYELSRANRDCETGRRGYWTLRDHVIKSLIDRGVCWMDEDEVVEILSLSPPCFSPGMNVVSRYRRLFDVWVCLSH